MKLVSANEMRSLDRRAARDYGVRGLVLMENAGRGVADIVARQCELEKGSRVSIIAGKGNNGGDGFVCARYLKNSGFNVTVFSTARPGAIKGDAGVNSRIWQRMGGPLETILRPGDIKKHYSKFIHSTVMVDGLLGTGLSSNVSGVYAALIEFINGLSIPVVAIDVPSGLDATTGRVLGSAVKARVTATMALPKIGLVVYPGRDFSGHVEVVDIGMPSELIDGADLRWNLIDDGEVRKRLGPRKRDTHKGTYGHVLVLGGSPGKTGAAYMAAMGALRAGAGLATLGVPESVHTAMEAKSVEVMTYPLSETDEKTLGECSWGQTLKLIEGKAVLVVGPGLGGSAGMATGMAAGIAGFLEKVLKRCKAPVVIDADGLNALEGRTSILKKARARCVLTPHPGEMATLLGVGPKDVQADRVGSARTLAKKTGSTVVLKGAATVVATPEGGFVNPTGNPGMATAGTGDVLSGMIGGLLAQGLSPVDAAVAGVYIHGLAGDRIAEERGEIGMVATDLLEKIPGILNSFAGPRL
jgi:NAD(P)H-hydrate epimerase